MPKRGGTCNFPCISSRGGERLEEEVSRPRAPFAWPGRDWRGFCFSDLGDVGDPARSRRFSQPSACVPSLHSPPRGNTFVENKDQSATRPSGHRTVEGILWYFSVAESGPISAFFFHFYCSVGRGSQQPKSCAAHFANCCLLIAWLSKIFPLPPLRVALL